MVQMKLVTVIIIVCTIICRIFFFFFFNQTHFSVNRVLSIGNELGATESSATNSVSVKIWASKKNFRHFTISLCRECVEVIFPRESYMCLFFDLRNHSLHCLFVFDVRLRPSVHTFSNERRLQRISVNECAHRMTQPKAGLTSTDNTVSVSVSAHTEPPALCNTDQTTRQQIEFV